MGRGWRLHSEWCPHCRERWASEAGTIDALTEEEMASFDAEIGVYDLIYRNQISEYGALEKPERRIIGDQ